MTKEKIFCSVSLTNLGNEPNNVAMPITLYDYTFISKSIQCNCQLQGENEFLHESLASCLQEDKVDKNIYFAINMAFAHQLQKTLHEAIQPKEFISKSTDILLYNVLLLVNCYISIIPIYVIAKTMNNIRTSYGYFIRSLGHCISPWYCIRSSRYF